MSVYDPNRSSAGTNTMVVKPSTRWHVQTRCRNRSDARCRVAREYILSCYPFIDHARMYVYKPQGQRGPARVDDTFIVSFAYMNEVDNTDDSVFLQAACDAGLTVCRYRTKFRGNDAYKIIVASKNVNILHALELLDQDDEEDNESEPPIAKWSKLNHMFQHPNCTSEERDQMKTAAPRRLSNNWYQCPHCSWVNSHGGEPSVGHHECDGPTGSEFVCVPQAKLGWNGMRYKQLLGWQMYECPGYTI